jgi:hypothetical protein
LPDFRLEERLVDCEDCLFFSDVAMAPHVSKARAELRLRAPSVIPTAHRSRMFRATTVSVAAARAVTMQLELRTNAATFGSHSTNLATLSCALLTLLNDVSVPAIRLELQSISKP